MGIKKNIVYSVALTTANYFFQLITFPYVSRVLGPENIGSVNFVQSIVHYFMLFSAMGVINLGVREIAKQTTRERRSECFSQIFIVNILMTTLCVSIYSVVVFSVPALFEYKAYFIIGIFQIIFNAFTIEWLFRGIEEFRYITVRSVIVRCIYVVCVLLCVKSPSDALLYFSLGVITFIINGSINWIYGRRYVDFSVVNPIPAAKKFIKPMFLLGSQALISFFYVGFNTVYLGLVSSDTQVGYYSTASKIVIIILALFTAVTAVLLPRMSALVSDKKDKEIGRLLSQTLNILFNLSIPLGFFIVIFASPIIYIIAGAEFLPATLALRISAPLILVLGVSQVFLVQIMMPLRMDRQLSLSCMWGAVVSIILNILLVRHMLCAGSMFIWLIAETVVVIRAFLYIIKHTEIRLDAAPLIKALIINIPLGCLFYLVDMCFENQYYCILCGALCMLLYIHISLYYIVKIPQYQSLINRFVYHRG